MVSKLFGVNCFLLYHLKIEKANNLCGYDDCISQIPNQEMWSDKWFLGYIQVQESTETAQTLLQV